MATLSELLKCAETNLYENGAIGAMLGRAQLKQYNQLKELGAQDDDDVDELLERYPEATLDLNPL